MSRVFVNGPRFQVSFPGPVIPKPQKRPVLFSKKIRRVSRILESILADLNSAVVCIVSILLQNSNYSNHFSTALGTVPNAQTTSNIMVNFICYRLFN